MLDCMITSKPENYVAWYQQTAHSAHMFTNLANLRNEGKRVSKKSVLISHLDLTLKFWFIASSAESQWPYLTQEFHLGN